MICLLHCSFNNKCAHDIVSLVLGLRDELTFASRVIVRIDVVTADDGLGDARRVNISGGHELSIQLGNKLRSSVLLVVNRGHRGVKDAALYFTLLKFLRFFILLLT